MIILRQREFGRTGLNKEQAKQFFKSGQGKINRIARRDSEAGIGNKVAKHLIKVERTVPKHKDEKAAAIYLGRLHRDQNDTAAPNLIDKLKTGVVKLKGDKSSIDHKINIRGHQNTNPDNGRPWKFDDDWKKTSRLIKDSTEKRF